MTRFLIKQKKLKFIHYHIFLFISSLKVSSCSRSNC